MSRRKRKNRKPTSKPYSATGGFLTGMIPRLFGKGNRQKGISIVKDD